MAPIGIEFNVIIRNVTSTQKTWLINKLEQIPTAKNIQVSDNIEFILSIFNNNDLRSATLRADQIIENLSDKCPNNFEYSIYHTSF